EMSMQYTSGTTSKPKGVLLTHANYIYGGEVMSKAMRVGPGDRHLIVLPLFHAGAQVHAFIPMLLCGGSVALMERFSATRFVEQAIRHEATLAALFAAPIRMLLAQPRSASDSRTRLRAISYAQNITPQQFEEWHARFRAPLMQIWGMTETMSLPLMQPLDLPRKPLAMGMPVLGYECKVVDVTDHGRDQAIKASVILKDGASATSEELIACCRARLSGFKVPERVQFRDVFPRTSVGKIQKHLF